MTLHKRLLTMTLLLLSVAGIVQSQTDHSKRIDHPISNQIIGEYEPIILEPIAQPPLALNQSSFLADPASQYCGLATTINIDPNGIPDGGQTIVNGAEEELDDPPLSCMVGNPVGPRSNQGYRTVWYQFFAPQSGLVKIQAHPNADYRENYDTVIAVYLRDDCVFLPAALACNDDHQGFLSEVTVAVTQGFYYLVEIADWQFGASSTKKLNLTAVFEPVDSLWHVAGSLPQARTYHSVVTVGSQAYVIAGETSSAGNPVRTGTMYRYDTDDGAWTQLPSMPGPDGRGYSRTDAAYLNGKIYLPAGYVGDSQIYDGAHWVYDIANAAWSTTTSNPHWENGEAYAYLQAVEVESPIPQYYVLGGLTGEFLTGKPHADLYIYLSDSDLWLAPNRPMSTARYAHVAEKVGDNICVAGGLGESNGSPIILKSAECYDIISGAWQSVGAMNFFRYNAASAVGANGKWYVWGGTNELGESLSSMEAYDPATGIWSILPAHYDILNPARAWAKGGFIGSDLWVFGGHLNSGSGDLVISLVERAMIPDAALANAQRYLPIIANQQSAAANNTMGTALPLEFFVNSHEAFSDPEDFFDLYYFDLNEIATVNVYLESIESQQGYDVEIYDSNKLWLASGQNVGNQNEHVILPNLIPGRYYVMIIRDFGQPTQDNYAVRVEK